MERQRAIQCQYNSSTVPTVPETETPFMYTLSQCKILHGVDLQQTVQMSTSCQNRFSNQETCLLALRKVQHQHNGRTSVNTLPLTKQDILSHSSCFEGIGRFPGEPYKFHLKPEHKPARHAPRKVPIHFEDAFKEEIKSLVKLGILEEVKNTLTGSIHM